ncbi:MAG: B12-binding domain-containing protein [Actinomycetota bacterium]
MTEHDRIDLQAAASKLGVHYQTAYRWVRGGRLAAELVDGRYLVRLADVERFDRERSTPARPTPPSDARVGRQSAALHEALTEGDEARARAIVTRLVADGLDPIALITDVLSPSLREIGRAWHEGEVDIWVEHRASAIVERALGDITPNPRGRRRGTAVVAAVSGDRHGLPTSMATVALRSSNWNVHHLGADTPPSTLAAFVDEHEIDLVVLSNTSPEVAGLTEETAESLREAGYRVLVGRPGATLRDLVDQAAQLRRRAA